MFTIETFQEIIKIEERIQLLYLMLQRLGLVIKDLGQSLNTYRWFQVTVISLFFGWIVTKREKTSATKYLKSAKETFQEALLKFREFIVLNSQVLLTRILSMLLKILSMNQIITKQSLLMPDKCSILKLVSLSQDSKLIH